MVLPFPEQQAALYRNTVWHQPTSSCSNGVPQGTVLGLLLFLIMIIDIDKGISPSSKIVSFADDIRLYSLIDFNYVYDWAHVNMFF